MVNDTPHRPQSSVWAGQYINGKSGGNIDNARCLQQHRLQNYERIERRHVEGVSK